MNNGKFLKWVFAEVKSYEADGFRVKKVYFYPMCLKIEFERQNRKATLTLDENRQSTFRWN